MTTNAEAARKLEAELEKYPEQRGEILIEAAQAWRHAGDNDRAIALLTEAIELDGENGSDARVELAEVLFNLDRTEQAQAQLEELRRQRPSSPTPYHLAAELLEARGEHQQALTWFDLAVAQLNEHETAGPDTGFGAFSLAGNIVAGRRRVRHELGMPPDKLDESVQTLPEDLAPAPMLPAPPQEARVLFWPRTEISRAHETWPRLVEHADTDTIVAEREAANRELSESGVTRIVMVPLTTAKLSEFAARTGGDPVAEETRLACLNEIVEEGGTISWPPVRNAPCWCGSSVKYKKCCGRPDIG